MPVTPRTTRIGRLALALALCGAATHCAQKVDTQKVDVLIDGAPAHSVTVPIEDVKRGGIHVYVVHGQRGEYAFALTDQNMRDLRDGKAVETRTTSSEAQVHAVTVRVEP